MTNKKLAAKIQELKKKYSKMLKNENKPAMKKLLACQLKHKCITQNILDEKQKLIEYAKKKLSQPDKMTNADMKKAMKDIFKKALKLTKLSLQNDSARCTLERCQSELKDQV